MRFKDWMMKVIIGNMIKEKKSEIKD